MAQVPFLITLLVASLMRSFLALTTRGNLEVPCGASMLLRFHFRYSFAQPLLLSLGMHWFTRMQGILGAHGCTGA